MCWNAFKINQQFNQWINQSINQIQEQINHIFDDESAILHRKKKFMKYTLKYNLPNCRVGWDWKIQWLLFCRGVRLPTSFLDMILNKLMVRLPVILELWGMPNTLSLPLFPRRFGLGVVTTNRVLSMNQIELNCVLMLNWIAWNENVLTFKLCTSAEMNCLKWNCFSYVKLNCLI